MKKLLTFLMTIGIMTPTVTGVVACMSQKSFNPLNIGIGIDKTRAIDDSVKGLESGFTNYYILGDSLSDVDGISNYLSDFGSPVITDIVGNMSAEVESIKLKMNLDGDGYGFSQDGQTHSSFSNGPTAGYILGKSLGFTDLRASNLFSKDIDEKEGYGNNYSIGGATSAPMEGITGTMLNNVTIDRQATALLEQHMISTNDLTFFEIGGNDLFAMIDDFKNTSEVERIFNEGISSIKTSLFTLLNNGMGKILFMTPPSMKEVPKYVNLFKNPTDANLELRIFIEEIGKKYQEAIMEVIDEAKTYYPDKIQVYDLYTEFLGLLDKFKNDKNMIVDEAYTDSSGTYVYVPDGSIMNLIGEINYKHGDYHDEKSLWTMDKFMSELETILGLLGGSSTRQNARLSFNISLQLLMLATTSNETKDINDYFFTDYVHPTTQVHEYVAELLEKMLLEDKK